MGKEVSRSRSSDCLQRISVPSSSTHLATPPVTQSMGVVRSRSYSDTERSLEQVMKDLEMMLMEDDSHLYQNHQRHLSNDSAVGESECVSSPLIHSHCVQPSSSACECSHEVSNSVDSAFSNNSSHTNSVSSTEAVNNNVGIMVNSPTPYASSSLPLHVRMSSGVSVQSDSMDSPGIIQVSSPKLPHKATLVNQKYSSLPALDPGEDPTHHPLGHRYSPSPFVVSRKFRKSSSAGKDSKKRRKRSGGSVENSMPEYNPRRSPILTHSPVDLPEPERTSIETTPTGSLCNDSAPLSPTSTNIVQRFHYTVDPSTELLI